VRGACEDELGRRVEAVVISGAQVDGHVIERPAAVRGAAAEQRAEPVGDALHCQRGRRRAEPPRRQQLVAGGGRREERRFGHAAAPDDDAVHGRNEGGGAVDGARVGAEAARKERAHRFVRFKPRRPRVIELDVEHSSVGSEHGDARPLGKALVVHPAGEARECAPGKQRVRAKHQPVLLRWQRRLGAQVGAERAQREAAAGRRERDPPREPEDGACRRLGAGRVG
jgi:hypothetical protein